MVNKRFFGNKSSIHGKDVFTQEIVVQMFTKFDTGLLEGLILLDLLRQLYGGRKIGRIWI